MQTLPRDGRPWPAALAFLTLMVLCAAPVQAQRKTDAQLRTEIAFARGLITELGFTDLAEEVLVDVDRIATGKFKEELALVQCDILALGARSEGKDPAKRNELYGRALDAYRDFVSSNPWSDHRPAAEAAFVKVSSEFGRSLSAALEEAMGEEALALQKKLSSALEAASVMSRDLADAILDQCSRDVDKLSEDQKRELFDLLLARGDMLLELAKAQEAGSFNFEESLSTYEELVFLAGEGTPYALRAFTGMGKNYVAQQLYDDASAFFEYVCNEAIPFDVEQWKELVKDQELGRAGIEQRFLFVQLGIVGLLDSLNQAGELGDSCQRGLYFHNIWKREGLNLQEGLGQMALMGVARTLVDAGGYVGGDVASGEAEWFATEEEMSGKHPSRRNQKTALDIALGLAQQVNRDMRGNILQVQAQKLIAEIISRPGIELDPSILYEAAEGEYNSRSFTEAAAAFKRVLAALDSQDQAARLRYGPRIFFYLGRSYQQLDRQLEAAMAFRHCIENYPDDPEHTPECAKRLYSSVKAMQASIRKDPLIDELMEQSERWLMQLTQGGGKDDVAYRQAEAAYNQARSSQSPVTDYQSAMRKFEAVGAGAEKYESAKVYVGICALKLKQHKDAEKVFEEYLNVYVTDPINAVNSPVQKARRSEAMALATLYLGLSAYEQAQWQKVIDRFQSFETDFPDQPNFAASAMYRRLKAYVELGDDQSVLRTQGQILRLFPTSKFAGLAADDAYDVFAIRYETAPDEEAKRTALRKMAELRRISNQVASKPAYTKMREESRHWLELGEWEEAQAALEKLIEAHAGHADARVQSALEVNIPADLGWALMMQQEVVEAAGLLGPLVEAKQAGREATHNYARCLTGWVEYRAGEGGAPPTLAIVPGVGGEDNFDAGIKLYDGLAGSLDKWKGPWYELRLDASFAYHQWGQADGKKAGHARSLLGSLRDSLGDRFERIEEPEIRARYQWVWDLVK